MAKPKLLVPIVVIAAAAVGAAWWGAEHLGWFADENPAAAWGSVDARHVRLSFEASGRIASLTKEEGERVMPGELLGTLDTRSLEIDRDKARAEASAKVAAWRLAAEGYRAEDIEQARESERALRHSLSLAQTTKARQEQLWKAKAASRQVLDEAVSQCNVLNAQLAGAAAVRRKMEAGLRPDEVAKAKAEMASAQAAAEALDYQIETASRLYSPVEGVVRSRLAEPGDMAGASKIVYELSITSPKWVRAFVTETQLRWFKEGAKARVTTDTTEPLWATVGFIASDAEFTPKPVQTQDLRAALVYEVRLNVEDPENKLRLGQPVTVDFAPKL